MTETHFLDKREAKSFNDFFSIFKKLAYQYIVVPQLDNSE